MHIHVCNRSLVSVKFLFNRVIYYSGICIFRQSGLPNTGQDNLLNYLDVYPIRLSIIGEATNSVYMLICLVHRATVAMVVKE